MFDNNSAILLTKMSIMQKLYFNKVLKKFI